MSKKPIPPPFTVTTKAVATPSPDTFTVALVSEDTCGTCRFWRNFNAVGHCHRYPATVRKDAASFCGEYKAK